MAVPQVGWPLLVVWQAARLKDWARMPVPPVGWLPVPPRLAAAMAQFQVVQLAGLSSAVLETPTLLQLEVLEMALVWASALQRAWMPVPQVGWPMLVA